MSKKPTLWQTLAEELDDALQRGLGGAEIAAEPRRTRGALKTGGAVRTRGAVRIRGAQSRGTPERVPVVVVEAPIDARRQTERRVRSRLKLSGAIDLYYVVPSGHWASLGPRELNPDDPERGRDHLLILRNLAADYALVLSSRERPEWARTARQVVVW
jgi:hypothetical protein